MLDGKVAIVTGGGRGLGRAEALQLAALGASVVVNDHGGSSDGTGASSAPAEEVTAEIRARGGVAAAHFGDVADFDYARSLVEYAVQEFGGLNILVNNAGILRDRLIFNMSEEEWDSVIRVHLKGHFACSRWATAYWRELAKSRNDTVFGRVINTASEAFLSGSVQQPNYAAAKSGIVALTLSTAKACEKYGVTANAICPRAHTRLTEHLDALGAAEFAPEKVAPLVGYLSSPAAARVSGQVFVVYGGRVDVIAGPRIDTTFETEASWTVEALSTALEPFYADRRPILDGFTLSSA